MSRVSTSEEQGDRSFDKDMKKVILEIFSDYV